MLFCFQSIHGSSRCANIIVDELIQEQNTRCEAYSEGGAVENCCHNLNPDDDDGDNNKNNLSPVGHYDWTPLSRSWSPPSAT